MKHPAEARQAERLWTTADVAQYLQQTEVHIRDRFRRGDFPREAAFKPPGSDRIMFKPEAIKAWIEGRYPDDEGAQMGRAEQ